MSECLGQKLISFKLDTGTFRVIFCNMRLVVRWLSSLKLRSTWTEGSFSVCIDLHRKFQEQVEAKDIFICLLSQDNANWSFHMIVYGNYECVWEFSLSSICSSTILTAAFAFHWLFIVSLKKKEFSFTYGRVGGKEVWVGGMACGSTMFIHNVVQIDCNKQHVFFRLWHSCLTTTRWHGDLADDVSFIHFPLCVAYSIHHYM